MARGREGEASRTRAAVTGPFRFTPNAVLGTGGRRGARGGADSGNSERKGLVGAGRPARQSDLRALEIQRDFDGLMVRHGIRVRFNPGRRRVLMELRDDSDGNGNRFLGAEERGYLKADVHAVA